jgi:hypothetical protein
LVSEATIMELGHALKERRSSGGDLSALYPTGTEENRWVDGVLGG